MLFGERVLSFVSSFIYWWMPENDALESGERLWAQRNPNGTEAGQ